MRSYMPRTKRRALPVVTAQVEIVVRHFSGPNCEQRRRTWYLNPSNGLQLCLSCRLKRELRRSEYRVASRGLGGTLWLRSAHDGACRMTALPDPPQMSHWQRLRRRWAIIRDRKSNPGRGPLDRRPGA